jgi:hypothetical protein
VKSGISIREFARREGVSDMLVRRALKLKRLKALPDKTIDPNLIGTPWRQGNAIKAGKGANLSRSANPAKGANPSGGANRTDGRPVAPKKLDGPGKRGNGRAPPPVDIDEPESLEEKAARRRLAGGIEMLDYGRALEKKENYLALLRQLEYEEKSGTLVDLVQAERALFEGTRAMRDAWLNWPVRVGAMIAADLGLEADKVTGILTAHVHKHVAQLGDPDVEFGKG